MHRDHLVKTYGLQPLCVWLWQSLAGIAQAFTQFSIFLALAHITNRLTNKTTSHALALFNFEFHQFKKVEQGAFRVREHLFEIRLFVNAAHIQ